MKLHASPLTPDARAALGHAGFSRRRFLKGSGVLIVTFSAASKEKVDYHFLNDTTIEAVVPEAKAGMSFIIVVAGGGSAQSKPVLIQTK